MKTARLTNFRCYLTTILAAFGVSPTAGAWDFPMPVRDMQERMVNASSVKGIYLHPFRKKNLGDVTFSLPQNGPMDLNKIVSTYLQQNLLNPMIKIEHVKTRGRGMHLDAAESSQSNDYIFSVAGIPICHHQIRAHKLKGAKQPIILGSMPNVNVYDVPNKKNWPNLDEAIAAVSDSLRDSGVASARVKVLDKDRCLLAFEQELFPVWSLIVESQGLPFKAIANDHKVFSLGKRFFDVEGTARAYEKNPEDGTLVTYSLTDLTGTGYLENDRFKTTVNSGSKAYNADHNFIYSPNDSEFDEASVFAHANAQGDFFANVGYEWSDSDQVNLVVHAVIDGSANNALYTPGSGKSLPKIQVGDGDGIRLDNLPKDSDVVSHELGHHIIFGTLTSVEGESLVIHEGLADYFAFANSGDACLGESICPSGSPIGCEINGKCLRSGENDYVLGENTKSEAHLKSQFISGMLWEMRDGSVPGSKLDKIVYRGVTLLQGSSGYHDMILGFLMADDELYNGKYCKTIYKAAARRGLESYIDDFDCSNLPDDGFTDKNGGSTGASVTSSSGDNKKKFLFCGVGAVQNNSSGMPPYLAILLLLMPALISMAWMFRDELTSKRRAGCYKITSRRQGQ